MLSQSSSVIRSGNSAGDPDYLYYTASIINNSTDTTHQADDPPITYQDTRSNPILADASQYVVSVEDFKLDGSGTTLPIFIPEIQSDPSYSATTTITETFAQVNPKIPVMNSTPLIMISVPPNQQSPATSAPYLDLSFKNSIIGNSSDYLFSASAGTYNYVLVEDNVSGQSFFGYIQSITMSLGYMTIVVRFYQYDNVQLDSFGDPVAIQSQNWNITITDPEPPNTYTITTTQAITYNALKAGVVPPANTSTITSVATYDESSPLTNTYPHLVSTSTQLYYPYINDTIYSVTFTNTIKPTALTPSTTLQSTRFIQWSPENKESWVAVPTIAYPQQPSSYYYCYSMDWFVSLLNAALAMAWTDVKNYCYNQGINMGTKIPFFQYDPNTKKFSILEDALSCWYAGTCESIGSSNLATANPTDPSTAANVYSFFGAPGSVSNLEYANQETSSVGMNTNLASLISNLPTKYFGANQEFGASGIRFSSPSGQETPANAVVETSVALYYPEVLIVPIPQPVRNTPSSVVHPYDLESLWTGGTYTFPTTNVAPTSMVVTPQYFRCEETAEKSISSVWSPIQSIVFTTNQIPIRTEYSSSIIPFGTGNLGFTNASSGNFYRILIETPVDEIDADYWRGLIKYTPATPKVSALSPSHEALSNLDLRVFWRNRLTNDLVPLTIPNQGSASIRLLFKRRGILD